MFKARAALCGALTLLIISGIAASAASAAGPFWHVNGAPLKTGSKAITATAGVAELKATVLGLSVTIACEAAKAENASIVGNGTGQGQDVAKAITFEKCSVSPKTCALTEGTIKTVEIKSHLVIFTNSLKEERIGDLIEPTAGTEFTTIHLKNNGTEECPFATSPFPVKGKVAAEVKPEGTELTVGELAFPTVPITKVKLEGNEVTVGLEIGNSSNKASFSASFATKLLSGEKFGAFKT